MKDITGYVKDSKYWEYQYRVPIFSTDHIYADNPYSLYSDNEYPRYVPSPNQIGLCVEERTDYIVRIPIMNVNSVVIQVWLQPNQYTVAKSELLVYEAVIENISDDYISIYCEYAVKRAFKSK